MRGAEVGEEDALHAAALDHVEADRVAAGGPEWNREDVGFGRPGADGGRIARRDDVAALRLVTRAVRDLPCTDYPAADGTAEKPGVILELDYWVLLPR